MTQSGHQEVPRDTFFPHSPAGWNVDVSAEHQQLSWIKRLEVLLSKAGRTERQNLFSMHLGAALPFWAAYTGLPFKGRGINGYPLLVSKPNLPIQSQCIRTCA